MCGISIFLYDKSHQSILSPLGIDYLKNRGPDCQEFITIETDIHKNITFFGCVLHQRGLLTKQPITDSKQENFLLWNGEIYNGLNIGPAQNDGEFLMSLLNKCHSDKEIHSIFEGINGPYSFIYYQKYQNCLYFGRDLFGRRSLLISKSNQGLLLTSCCLNLPNDNDVNLLYEEVPALGIYKLHIESGTVLDLNLWDFYFDSSFNELLNSSENFKSVIVCRDLLKTPIQPNIPDTNPIQLRSITECLRDENVPELVRTASQEMCAQCDKLLKVLSTSVITRVTLLPSLCTDCLPHFDISVETPDTPCSHSRIAILFSGGLDSAVLAALVDKCLSEDESIDLYNIAFENMANESNKPPMNKKHPKKFCGDCDPYLVPDRVTGLKTFEDLKLINPKRKWNFVEINVPIEELKLERNSRIRFLIHPHNTVLDDSLGCALWFAARGKGLLRSEIHPHLTEDILDYKSPARIVLLGMGADELMAGYSRHRVVYEKGGIEGLEKELDMEIKRISSRNLGRDDRVISDHSRESRLPYLDENVVAFLRSLPCDVKANLNLPRGQGDKQILRLIAWNLGLVSAAVFPKRALQFGSKIAKAEASKEVGNNACDRLTL